MWDYPRPPRLEASDRHVRVAVVGHAGGGVLADSVHAIRVLERSHPPTWYIPPQDCATELFAPAASGTFCEFKGQAQYWTVASVSSSSASKGGRPGTVVQAADVAAVWSYPLPSPGYAAIRGYFAFYADRFACYVDDVRVDPQPGGFYGGWITPEIVGPFKGTPGTAGW